MTPAATSSAADVIEVASDRRRGYRVRMPRAKSYQRIL